MARNNGTPPPGNTPSSTAARVALSASSTRSFFSLTSTSVAPPTRITATPPASLAKGTFSGKIVIVDLPAQEYRLAGQMAALA
jgi:hypothetical protein